MENFVQVSFFLSGYENRSCLGVFKLPWYHTAVNSLEYSIFETTRYNTL